MNLLIISYHYIGDEHKGQRGIYPISQERFLRQIDAIAKNWKFVSEDDLILAISDKLVLPEKSCIITFDDALLSQYELAVPILEKRGIPAIFFVSTRHISEHKAYLVHKIHYLLHKVSIKELISEFEKSYQDVVNKPIDWSSMDSVRATNYYLYDDADTARLKFFINHIMSRKDITEEIVDALFIRYCSDEANFCKSLYMFEKEIRLLHEHDLFSIGIHTHTHSNVVKEKKDVFISEIVKNQNILSEQLGIQSQGIAYPFGAVTRELYEEKIEKGVESLGLTYGLTTEEKINKDFNNPFLLGRFNSEDITHGKKPEFSV